MAKTNSRRIKKTSAAKVEFYPKIGKNQIGVFGASGRMGQEVMAVLKEMLGEKSYLAASDLKSPACKEIKIWIDFSSPAGFTEIFNFCQKNKAALVSGTTGLSKEQLKIMSQTKVPFLWSPNMSLGINILLKALRALKGAEGFDLQVEEFHHRLKKDKPSGTALLIQAELESLLGVQLEKPLSVRGGGVFGIHKVWAMSDEETITFEHQALNRRVFAKGAIQAAQWLKNQKPGFYSIQDLLARA